MSTGKHDEVPSNYHLIRLLRRLFSFSMPQAFKAREVLREALRCFCAPIREHSELREGHIPQYCACAPCEAGFLLR